MQVRQAAPLATTAVFTMLQVWREAPTPLLPLTPQARVQAPGSPPRRRQEVVAQAGSDSVRVT